MADKYVVSNRLEAVARFADDDYRTLTLPNPVEDLTAEQIRALEPAAKKVLIGDKAGADFVDFKSAKIIDQTTVYLDLTAE